MPVAAPTIPLGEPSFDCCQCPKDKFINLFNNWFRRCCVLIFNISYLIEKPSCRAARRLFVFSDKSLFGWSVFSFFSKILAIFFHRFRQEVYFFQLVASHVSCRGFDKRRNAVNNCCTSVFNGGGFYNVFSTLWPPCRCKCFLCILCGIAFLLKII